MELYHHLQQVSEDVMPELTQSFQEHQKLFRLMRVAMDRQKRFRFLSYQNQQLQRLMDEQIKRKFQFV